MKLSHINHDEKIYTAVFLNFILTSRIKVKVNGGHYNHDNEYVPSYKTLISNRGLCHLIRLIRKEQKLQQAN